MESSAVATFLTVIGYGIGISYFFIFMNRQDVKFLREDYERSLKQLEERTERSLERLQESYKELRRETYKR